MVINQPTRINHLFYVINNRAENEAEKERMYEVTRRVMKVRDDLRLGNSVREMIDRRHEIGAYLDCDDCPEARVRAYFARLRSLSEMKDFFDRDETIDDAENKVAESEATDSTRRYYPVLDSASETATSFSKVDRDFYAERRRFSKRIAARYAAEAFSSTFEDDEEEAGYGERHSPLRRSKRRRCQRG